MAKIKKGRSIIIAAITITLAIVFLALYKLDIYVDDYKNYIQLYVEKVDYFDDSSLVHLGNGCSKFMFYTSREQGKSIELGIKGIKTPRPMTHDIIVTILNDFNIKPVAVKINSLSDNIYLAELISERYQKIKIDIRPSDGVAIAVRTKIPIYVSKTLVKNVCEDLF